MMLETAFLFTELNVTLRGSIVKLNDGVKTDVLRLYIICVYTINKAGINQITLNV